MKPPPAGLPPLVSELNPARARSRAASYPQPRHAAYAKTERPTSQQAKPPAAAGAQPAPQQTTPPRAAAAAARPSGAHAVPPRAAHQRRARPRSEPQPPAAAHGCCCCCCCRARPDAMRPSIQDANLRTRRRARIRAADGLFAQTILAAWEQAARAAARAPSRPLPCRRSRQGPEADRQPAWPMSSRLPILDLSPRTPGATSVPSA